MQEACWIPAGIELESVVGRNRRRQAAAARLLNLLHLRSDRRKYVRRCPDGYVPLWSDRLFTEVASKDLFYGREGKPGVREQLRVAGLISWRDHYSTTEHHAKGYRVEEPYASGEWVAVRVIRKRPPIEPAELQPVDQYLLECLGRMQFEVPREVLAYLRSYTQRFEDRLYHPYRCQAEAIETWSDRIQNYADHKISWRTGRCHNRRYTAFTQLKRDLRGYGRVEGQRLFQIDLTNLHPLVVGVLALQHPGVSQCEIGGSFAEYTHHYQYLPTPYRNLSLSPSPSSPLMFPEKCSIGGCDWLDLCQPTSEDDLDLYEHVLLGLDDGRLLRAYNRRFKTKDLVLKRKHTKRALLCYLNSSLSICSNGIQGPVERFLRERFPMIHQFVQAVKEEDHRELFYRMVAFETHLIFERLVPALMDQLPGVWLATVHDAIFTTGDRVETVEAIIRGEFQEMGLHPRLKVEPCQCLQMRELAAASKSL